MSKKNQRRDYDGRYQRQPKYAAKNLRLGRIAPEEVETFSRVSRMAGKTRNRLERPTEIVEIAPKEVFCQCWKCLSVMTLDMDATTQELRCRYCRGPVEVLTVDGVPQP